MLEPKLDVFDVIEAFQRIAAQHQEAGLVPFPQMADLSAEPLGIEYRVADAATLGKIGSFDRVSAAYLLHYAESREQLRQMMRTAYDNLEPGQRFVASITNPFLPPRPVVDQRK